MEVNRIDFLELSLKQEYINRCYENISQNEQYFYNLISGISQYNLSVEQKFIALAQYLLPEEFEKGAEKPHSFLTNLNRLLLKPINLNDLSNLMLEVCGPKVLPLMSNASLAPCFIHLEFIKSGVLSQTSIPMFETIFSKKPFRNNNHRKNGQENIKYLSTLNILPKRPLPDDTVNLHNYTNLITIAPIMFRHLVNSLTIGLREENVLQIRKEQRDSYSVFGFKGFSKLKILNILISAGVINFSIEKES